MDNLPAPPQSDPKETPKQRDLQQRQIPSYIGYIMTALIISWLFQRIFLMPSLEQTSEISYSSFKQNFSTGQKICSG